LEVTKRLGELFELFLGVHQGLRLTVVGIRQVVTCVLDCSRGVVHQASERVRQQQHLHCEFLAVCACCRKLFHQSAETFLRRRHRQAELVKLLCEGACLHRVLLSIAEEVVGVACQCVLHCVEATSSTNQFT